MSEQPKNVFNNQLINNTSSQYDTYHNSHGQGHSKRIISLIKESNVNGLINFLDSIEMPSQYINQRDKNLNQTCVYHAVQVKEKSTAYSIVNTLLQYGVIDFN